MAEELNMHFSSVFTREDTSSLPVPETKFNGTEGERLGQLVITPEVIAGFLLRAGTRVNYPAMTLHVPGYRRDGI